ncbi:hypothetical protein J1N35_034482, partial [Gossypium stocksii]
TNVFHLRRWIKANIIHHTIFNGLTKVRRKKYILAHLDPKDVHNDQIKMMKFKKEVMGSEEESYVLHKCYKGTYIIEANLKDQNNAFDLGDSFGEHENVAKDLGTNLRKEKGNDTSLKAQFRTHRCDRLTLPQGPTTMSEAKQIKPRFN